jgi:hypothetical protein
MKILIVLVLLVVAPMGASAQKVKVTSAPGIDFAKYKTYSWDQGMMANPLVRQLVVAAVDNAMAAKGLQKVESNPDLMISALASTDSDLTVTNPSSAASLSSISTGIATSGGPWAVTKGTLLIVISDAKTKNGVWQGTASETLDHGPTGDRVRDAKNVEKPINKAVQKMFKKFPPRSKQ